MDTTARAYMYTKTFIELITRSRLNVPLCISAYSTKARDACVSVALCEMLGDESPSHDAIPMVSGDVDVLQ